MAYNVKGITIEIGADATKLTDALSKIENQYRGLDKTASQLKRSMSLRGVDAALTKGFGTSFTLIGDQINRAKANIEAYTKTLNNWSGNVQSWKTQIETSKQAIAGYDAEIQKSEAVLRSYQTSHSGAKSAVKSCTTEIEKIKSKISEYENELKTATTTQTQYRNKITELKAALQAEVKTYNDIQAKSSQLEQSYAKLEINAKSFEEAQSKLNAELSEQSNRVQRATNNYQAYVDLEKEIHAEKQQLTAKVKELNSALRDQESKLQSSQAVYKHYGDAIKKTKETIANLKAERAQEQSTLSLTTEKLNSERESRLKVVASLEAEQNKLQSLLVQQRNVAAAGDKMVQTLEKMKAAAEGTAERLNQVAESTRMISILSGAGLVYATKEAIDYESAWTGVTKTVEGTPQQMQKLDDQLRQLALTTASGYKEIATYAEMAGQMGVATDEVAGFTKTITELNDTTNLQGEEAAQKLAQFANVMVPKDQRVADYYERIGSVIVDLGNNFATTEDDIMQMTSFMAPAARAVGMTSQQALALSAALSSVGIRANAGGSSMSKLMSRIQLAVSTGSDDLQKLASVSGMSAEQFAQAWRDDAGTAFMQFIEAIGNSGDVTKTLDDLDMSEVRLTNSTRALSQSSDIYKDALLRANSAYESNTAMAAEAEKRYSTLESQLKQAKEAVNQAAESFGKILAPYVKDAANGIKDFAKWLEKLPKGTKDAIVKFTALTAAIYPVTKGMAGMASGFGKFFGGIDKQLKTFDKFKTGLKQVKEGSTDLGEVMTSTFGVSGKAMLWGAGITAVSMALVGLNAYIEDNRRKAYEAAEALDQYKTKGDALSEIYESNVEAAKSAKDSADQVVQSYYQQSAQAEALAQIIRELNSEESLSETQKLLLADAVAKLNAIYPDLNLKIDENTGKLAGNTEELNKNLEAAQKNARQKAIMTAIEETTAALNSQKLAYDAANENVQTYQKGLDDARKALEDFKKAHTGENFMATPEYQRLSDQVEYYRQKLDEAKQAMEENNQTMAETQSQLMMLYNQFDTGGMDQIGDTIKNSWNDVVQGAKESGFEVPQAFADGMANNSMTVGEASNLVGAMIQFQSGVDNAHLFGGQIPEALAYEILAGAQSPADAVAQLNKLFELNDALANSQYAGTQIPKEIAQAVLDGKISVDDAVTQIGQSTKQKITESGVDQTAKQEGQKAANAFDEAFKPTVDKAGQTANGVKRKIESVDLGATGSAFGASAFNGAMPHFVALETEANAHISNVKWNLNALASTADQVKNSIVQALRAGASGGGSAKKSGGHTQGPNRAPRRMMSPAALMTARATYASSQFEVPAPDPTPIAKAQLSRMDGTIAALTQQLDELTKISGVIQTIAAQTDKVITMDSKPVGRLVSQSVRNENARYDVVQKMLKGENV